jgi:hypothetical protein
MKLAVTILFLALLATSCRPTWDCKREPTKAQKNKSARQLHHWYKENNRAEGLYPPYITTKRA